MGTIIHLFAQNKQKVRLTSNNVQQNTFEYKHGKQDVRLQFNVTKR